MNKKDIEKQANQIHEMSNIVTLPYDYEPFTVRENPIFFPQKKKFKGIDKENKRTNKFNKSKNRRK